MNNHRTILFSVFILSVLLMTCQSSTKLPETIIGKWYPNNNKFIAFQFEEKGGKGTVHYSSIGYSEEQWIGPIEIKSIGHNQWKFNLQKVKKSDTGNGTVTYISPPELKTDLIYAYDEESGYTFLAAWTSSKGKREIMCQLKNQDTLIIKGLMTKYEVVTIDRKDFSPKKIKETVLENLFIKSHSMTNE